jgi:hypothetical protein
MFPIASTWFSPGTRDIIGIVLGIDVITEEYKAYIGRGYGHTIDGDVEFIMQYGAKFPWAEAVMVIQRHGVTILDPKGWNELLTVISSSQE